MNRGIKKGDQEEKEAEQERNINQSLTMSVAKPCRQALGTEEVTPQNYPDQTQGSWSIYVVIDKGLALGNMHPQASEVHNSLGQLSNKMMQMPAMLGD